MPERLECEVPGFIAWFVIIFILSLSLVRLASRGKNGFKLKEIPNSSVLLWYMYLSSSSSSSFITHCSCVTVIQKFIIYIDIAEDAMVL